MTRFTFVLFALGMLGMSGCGDDDEAAAPASSGTTTVNLALSEFAIAPSPAAAPAGNIKFVAKNNGADVHEVVIVKTALTAAQLPKNADGTFNEDDPAVSVVNEIEDIDPAATKELALPLVAGHYVLVCNIVEGTGATAESHFHEGMFVDFTVQ